MSAQRSGRVRAASDDPQTELLESLIDKMDALSVVAGTPAPQTKGGDGGVYLPKWALNAIIGVLSILLVSTSLTIMDLRTDVKLIQSNMVTTLDVANMRRSIENTMVTHAEYELHRDAEIARLNRIEARLNGGGT